VQTGGDLRRSLGPAQVVAAGIACSVGSRVYLSLGDSVAPQGPFVVWAYILARVACGLTTLSYARFAARFPEAGSTFSSVVQAYGPKAGGMTVWTLLLEYIVGAGAVVVGVELSDRQRVRLAANGGDRDLDAGGDGVGDRGI